MKSKIFSSFDPFNEDNKPFQRDLALLLELTEDDRQRLIDELPKLVAGGDSPEEAAATSKFVESFSNQVAVVGAVACLEFFLRQFEDDSKKDDTPEALAEDLRDLDLLESKQMEPFVASVRQLKQPEVLGEYERRHKQRIYEAGLLPSLSNFGTTVELRGIRSSTFDVSGSVDDYHPTFVSLIPVASIRINLDMAPKSFTFQVSKTTLEFLIRGLQACLKDLQALDTVAFKLDGGRPDA